MCWFIKIYWLNDIKLKVWHVLCWAIILIDKLMLCLGDPFTNSGSCTECANGMKFTTRDRDNDNDPNVNCATSSGGGWWHNACQRSNLNGRARQTNYRHGLNWDGLTDISSVEMKVRKPWLVQSFMIEHLCFSFSLLHRVFLKD